MKHAGVTSNGVEDLNCAFFKSLGLGGGVGITPIFGSSVKAASWIAYNGCNDVEAFLIAHIGSNKVEALVILGKAGFVCGSTWG